MHHLLGLTRPGQQSISLAFVLNTWILCVLLMLGALIVGRNLKRIPGKLQNAMEVYVAVGQGFTRGVLGAEGTRYTPFILTLFTFILVGSVLGIIPGFTAPTANVNTTIALAAVAFLYVNYQAIRTVGFVGFVKSFFPPPIWMAWLTGPLEILSHLIRPVTLAVRLFGNIFGEDVVIAVLIGFGLIEWGFNKAQFLPIPLQFPIMIFSLLTDIVQAAVFCMLTTIYIQLLTSHGHGSDHEHDAAHSEPAGGKPVHSAA